MAEKQLPNAGIGTGATLTTTLVGILSSISALVPEEYQDAYVKVVPYLCPFIAWVFIRAYNYFLEPEELASARRKLERDLKSSKKALKDRTLTDEEKKPFREDYIATRLCLSRLGRDFNAKQLQVNQTVDKTSP